MGRGGRGGWEGGERGEGGEGEEGREGGGGEGGEGRGGEGGGEGGQWVMVRCSPPPGKAAREVDAMMKKQRKFIKQHVSGGRL